MHVNTSRAPRPTAGPGSSPGIAPIFSIWSGSCRLSIRASPFRTGVSTCRPPQVPPLLECLLELRGTDRVRRPCLSAHAPARGTDAPGSSRECLLARPGDPSVARLQPVSRRQRSDRRDHLVRFGRPGRRNVAAGRRCSRKRTGAAPRGMVAANPAADPASCLRSGRRENLTDSYAWPGESCRRADSRPPRVQTRADAGAVRELTTAQGRRLWFFGAGCSSIVPASLLLTSRPRWTLPSNAVWDPASVP